MDALRLIYEQAAARSGPIDVETLRLIMAENEKEIGSSLHAQSVDALSTQKGQPYQGTARYTSIFPNGVAVMNLFGPIYPRANMQTEYSGATSIAKFVMEYAMAMDDPQVQGIVINSDSPGGDVRGIGDAAQVMYTLAQKKRKKPVKTYASGLMASAAYWIGSTSQELWASQYSAMTGSIGVVLSVRKNDEGRYDVVSSQSPYKRVDPSTPEGQNILGVTVNDLASIFIENVALHRGITSAKVEENYGQGQVFATPRAKQHKMLDKIGTLSEVIEMVAKEAKDGTFKATSRKVSVEVQSLLSFSAISEEDNMGLKELAKRFRASNETLFDASEDDKAQSDTVTDESESSVTGGEGQEEGADTAAGATTAQVKTAMTQKEIQAKRDELEESFSVSAELFATQMTLGHRIMPSEQGHAASDLLTAMIDDVVVGGTVRYVSAEGDVVEGTREEAARARYAARPQHSMTQKAIAGLKEGSVEAKVLAEEDKKAKDDDAPVSADRRAKLLSQTETGQRVLAANKSAQ